MGGKERETAMRERMGGRERENKGGKDMKGRGKGGLHEGKKVRE